MTAGTQSVATAQAPSLPARLFGLGSIFGKSVRDGRRAAIAVSAVVVLMMLAGASALAAEWPTAALREQLVSSMQLLPPFIRNLLGEPIAIDTLGGFLSWRFGNILPVMLGLWSVLALSGTLAAEAQRGSLDLLASTPVSRRRIAIEKLLGHVALVAAVMLVGALATVLAGSALGTIPEDAISPAAALGHYALTGLLMLAAGSVAFAAAPALGRGGAAGLGAIALFGGYLIFAYRAMAPALDGLSPLSWYAWTAGHRPLAGEWDWAPVLALAVLTVVLFAVGVAGFQRRDIGLTIDAGRGRLPSLPAGTSGPFARQLAERAGIAIAAGIGIGIYGGMIAASAEGFIESLAQMPGMDELVSRLYPGVDITQPSGILQLAFFAFGSVLVGFAAAALVGGWASDENDNRLDFIVSTPLPRARWFVLSALGVYAAIALVVALATLVIAIGVASSGGELLEPVAGGLVLGLVGMAFAGIGIAVGGLGRPGIAGVVAGAAALTSYLLALLGNALQLPEWLIDLSLHEHFGQPMSGVFDLVGLAAMLLLAFGGIVVGGLGFLRRDLGR